MAHQVFSKLKDDLNPDLEADRTVLFSFDGEDYEIDLTEQHYAEMRDRFYAYLIAGRKRAKPKPKRKRTPAAESAAMRSFARDHGMRCGDRGRIPGEVVRAYKESRYQSA